MPSPVRIRSKDASLTDRRHLPGQPQGPTRRRPVPPRPAAVPPPLQGQQGPGAGSGAWRQGSGRVTWRPRHVPTWRRRRAGRSGGRTCRWASRLARGPGPGGCPASCPEPSLRRGLSQDALKSKGRKEGGPTSSCTAAVGLSCGRKPRSPLAPPATKSGEGPSPSPRLSTDVATAAAEEGPGADPRGTSLMTSTCKRLREFSGGNQVGKSGHMGRTLTGAVLADAASPPAWSSSSSSRTSWAPSDSTASASVVRPRYMNNLSSYTR